MESPPDATVSVLPPRLSVADAFTPSELMLRFAPSELLKAPDTRRSLVEL